ncbi:hypothetical protein [Chakrabartyella piscis]|uniref:hypothetical protein n=1 Tax=Chakrabartyella piscis TaxID=2918914 RepID=UPI00295873F4|nr:hypothetical protein [Chakrabartyella piscis]
MSKFEEKLKQLSTDYIYHQGVGSLLLLLISVMEEEEAGVTVLPYAIHDDILQIRKDIRTHILGLEELLDGSEDNVEAKLLALQSAMEMKQALFTIYGTIYSYFSQWNIISTLISDQVALRRYADEEMSKKQVDWSLFFGDCHAFLESPETVMEQKQYISQMLKCMPLSITRDKFFQEVLETLEIAFADESLPIISASLQAFEHFCCPETNELYGRYFPELAEFIAEKKQINPAKLTNEELDDLYAEMQESFETLEGIEEYFSCIFHDINSLVLLYTLSYSFADLTEQSISHADLYHAVCDFIGGELTLAEKAAYLDSLNEGLEAAVEPVIDRATAIRKEEVKMMERIQSFADLDEDTTKTLMMEDYIRKCYFNDMNEELFDFQIDENAPLSTKEERSELFATFLAHTRTSFDALPMGMRKVAMQTLMGALPPIYSVQEVMNRLMDYIDNHASLDQQLLIVDKIGTVFAEFGYESVASNSHEHHLHEHHHEHGEHCGCGHDHEYHHH